MIYPKPPDPKWQNMGIKKARTLAYEYWLLQGRRCIWCGKTTWHDKAGMHGELRNKATIEHLYAKRRKHKPAGVSRHDLVVSACHSCNNERGGKTFMFKPLQEVGKSLPENIKRELLFIAVKHGDDEHVVPKEVDPYKPKNLSDVL